MTQFEASAIKDIESFVMWTKSLKTYQEYPKQKDNSFNDPQPSVQLWKVEPNV